MTATNESAPLWVTLKVTTDPAREGLAHRLREIATLLETGCVFVEGGLAVRCVDGLIRVDSNLVIRPGVIQ